MPLGPTIEAKICPWNDTFLDPRLQRSRHSNNSDRSLEQQDMHGVGSYAKLMEWQELLSFLSGGGGKKILFCNVFSDVIFYPRVLQ